MVSGRTIMSPVVFATDCVGANRPRLIRVVGEFMLETH